MKRSAAGSPLGRIGRLAAQADGDRDRVVDLLRAASIVVVILWHWTLSVTQQRADGVLVMPNPIPQIPFGWAATWLLQVMPVFFLVGGYANLAGWRSVRRAGGGTGLFLSRRVRRLLIPVVVFLIVWAVVETVLWAVGLTGVAVYGPVLVSPLWFIAVYLVAVLLVPLTARLHERCPLPTLAALGIAVALFDFGRFALGISALAWVNTVLIWIFVHQLGYFHRDGTLPGLARSRLLLLTVGALAGLVLLTGPLGYPRSMVAHEGAELSNMYPTTAVIAVLGVFQLGVLMLAGPFLARWLQRRRVWTAVVAANMVIMTMFVWHMTALLLALGTYHALGFELLREPTAEWWAQRPVWLLLPAVFLALLVVVFHRAETGSRRPRADPGTALGTAAGRGPDA
ncbi:MULTISPECIES: acyltransferase family protein [Actinoalloteichus]|uniref:Acyltransferase family protein n=1 Tax=Actinoalloteichus fjordicus TaxID=1612552 RepID=A0AAC9PRZ1_9PSEU|nr:MULTISPECIES: acyltransferase [Actinoalloteichus]APU14286.1 acyltransferase family protein [Actinoalloteichus fjordicus]APU20256.1 acyltransferase family protein [Actinoalloteichus sp. GBA129-24]